MSVGAQTDPSAAHAAIAAAAALGTLAEVARRLPRTVPAKLARVKSAPSALAGFIDERAHARMCAAADRALVCTAPTVSAARAARVRVSGPRRSARAPPEAERPGWRRASRSVEGSARRPRR